MASLFGVLCTSMIIFLGATDPLIEAAREFKVGDHLGWHEPCLNNTAFYSQWSARNRFQVGDSLIFEYQNDPVLAVEKWDYFHCDSSDPINSFDNGNSTLNLDRPGAFYFISGTALSILIFFSTRRFLSHGSFTFSWLYGAWFSLYGTFGYICNHAVVSTCELLG